MDYSQTILGTVSGVLQLATDVSNRKLLFFGTAVHAKLVQVWYDGISPRAKPPDEENWNYIL